MEIETFRVVGMSCGHCVAAVTAELLEIDGVTDVHVDLATGGVTVHSVAPVAPALVAAAVEEAGYEVQT